MALNSFLRERKRNKTKEGGGRILLGDDTGDGAIVLWTIREYCCGVKPYIASSFQRVKPYLSVI